MPPPETLNLYLRLRPMLYFEITGRPGDSPESLATTIFEQKVNDGDFSTAIAVAEHVAIAWTENAQWGCSNILEVEALHLSFLARLVTALQAWPDLRDSEDQWAPIFKDETCDESAFITRVRVSYEAA